MLGEWNELAEERVRDDGAVLADASVRGDGCVESGAGLEGHRHRKGRVGVVVDGV